MKKFTKIKKIITALIVSVVVFFSGQVFLPANFSHVKAAEVNNFDKSLVINDLSDIDITKYPADEEGDPYVIRFIEYCYSEKPFLAENYGLYIYLYNPNEKELDTSNITANMAIDYNEAGKPSSYENIELSFLNKTENNRFYKFKVTDSISFLNLQKKYMLDFFCRRYDIVGIEFKYLNGKSIKAKDFPVGKTIIYKGYSKGCGSNNKSDLVCEFKDLEVVQPTVGHTNYRFNPKESLFTGLQNIPNYEIRDELNSVYFSVPNDIILSYGGLQKVKAKWYEYKTAPVFLTSNYDAWLYFYNEGVRNSSLDTCDWQLLWELGSFVGDLGFYYCYGESFNEIYPGNNWINLTKVRNWDLNANTLEDLKEVHDMFYIFYSEGQSASNYKISREKMSNWMLNYIGDIIPYEMVPDTDKVLNRYHKNLFVDSIDERRLYLLEDRESGNNPNATNGLIIEEISADDDKFLMSSTSQNTDSGFKNWWNRLFNNLEIDDIKYSPIEPVTKAELESLSQEDFCDKYFVNSTDYKDIREAIITAYENDETFYLFRFAVTDYYSSPAIFDDYILNDLSANHVGTDTSKGFTDNINGYVAQETVFLNFDTISLTFRKDGVDTVIGVVSDPFDIINGLEPPLSLTEENWLMKILAIVALILVLVVIGPFLSPILTIAFNLLGKLIAVLLKALALVFKFIWSILTFPFRLLKPK